MTDRDRGWDPGDEPDDRAPSMRVVDCVAAANGVEPEDLDPPLHEAVDPSALDSLFDAAGDARAANSSVTFRYAGHEVTVGPDGAVSLG